MLHEYPNINPNRYNVNVKIATVRTGSHCKFNIKYHIIWIPKYRKKLLKGKVKEALSTILEDQCKELKLQMLALEIMSVHLHLFVSAKPTHVPCDIVKKLKGNSSIQLRKRFEELHYLGYRRQWKHFKHLWTRGYYCGSAGHVSQNAVKQYIPEQDGKDVF